MSVTLPVLAATGMVAEARIARGSGVATVAGGGDPARLALMLQGALLRGAKAVISFGIAGGLAAELAPGTAILARAVHGDGVSHAADPAWTARLARLLPEAVIGDLAGVDRIVAGAEGKRGLRARTGAVAVDMESHIAARLAAQHGVPFAALRIVADPAHRSLPEAAMVGMRPDGSMDARAVLRALARRPGDIPALVRTVLDASAAFAGLKDCRQKLCGSLGFDEVVTTGPAAVYDPAGGHLGVFGAEVQVENG